MNIHAQNNNYTSYRNQMLDNFQRYRKNIIQNYADFLNDVWLRYDTFKGIKRDRTPKPSIVPSVEDNPICSNPTEIPTPEVHPFIPIVPQLSNPSVPTMPMIEDNINFIFYSMELEVPKISFKRLDSRENKDIAKVWKEYQQSNTNTIIPRLQKIAKTNGLNDWFTFQMIRQYVDTIANTGNEVERIILQHFLLVNMGFDVRLAKTETQMLLLVPFKQQVYERSYINLDDKKYYIFCDNTEIVKELKNIYTCSFPEDAWCGRFLDLKYNCQNKIEKGEYKKRELTDGCLVLNGSVNIILMEMLRHYPQMDVSEYARSTVDEKLRKSILSQLRPQIQTLSQKEAANQLIHFVQYAFDYATDGEQHGYEKAYFLEENFYYPKNDCEDRAIFYAFLVKNLLGLDVHLVSYPGHECTAVNFTDPNISGDGYFYEGKKYVICDPTYIGAKIGMCMPNYKNVKPIVELWY